MKRGRRLGLILLGAALALLAGCGSGEGTAGLLSLNETYEKEAADEGAYQVADRDSLYESGHETDVAVLYLTVGRGNEADGTDHTWAEVNRYPLGWYDGQGLSPYSCEAVLQVGDELGPLSGEFGYGTLAANATVQLKGEKASTRAQKSYRIKIKDGKGNWDGQKVIVLNKYTSDPVRFSEMLCYDVMREIPQMLSARTRLVHLYVKDRTEGADGLFEDYGLYVQAEQVNKAYLKNRNLDSDGQLYKLEGFDFALHEDALRPATDASYDKAAFERYLEIKGSEDHTKLLEMLKAVNDSSVPIGRVLEQYFDRENLYAWMAFQILTGNKDSGVNAYLYSPQMLNKWYFISTDNDNAFREIYEELRSEDYDPSWNRGIGGYTGSVLFARLLQDEQCRRELSETVDRLRGTYLTREKLTEKAERYSAAVKSYLYRLPDKLYARVAPESYDAIVSRIGGAAEEYAREYRESLEKPWPFHILDPEVQGGRLSFQWEEAYLHGGESAVYSVEVARSHDFQSCLLERDQLASTHVELEFPGPGQYFIRVRAKTRAGLTQDAYEYYRTEQGTVAASTLCFYILDGGTVAVSTYEEDAD